MFVVSKNNIILPGPNGEKFHMPRDYMGPIPAWAEDSAYLKALVADGKVIVSENGMDKDFSNKEKKPKKAKTQEKDKEPENEPKKEDPEPESSEAPNNVAE